MVRQMAVIVVVTDTLTPKTPCSAPYGFQRLLTSYYSKSIMMSAEQA